MVVQMSVMDVTSQLYIINKYVL